MSGQIEIVIPEFGKIDDEHWDEAKAKALGKYSNALAEQSYYEASVSIRNIGHGADWLVVVVSLVSAFFAIPRAHKLVRETIEEWLKIYAELSSVIKRVAPRRALLPDAYLFLVALDHILTEVNPDNAMFQGFVRIPENNPDLGGYENLIFHFTDSGNLHQVCVARSGKVLWDSVLELTEDDA